MNKRMQALAMLNLAFESHDGTPVEQAIITAADYRLLFEALMEPTAPAMRWNPNTGNMETYSHLNDLGMSKK